MSISFPVQCFDHSHLHISVFSSFIVFLQIFFLYLNNLTIFTIFIGLNCFKKSVKYACRNYESVIYIILLWTSPSPDNHPELPRSSKISSSVFPALYICSNQLLLHQSVWHALGWVVRYDHTNCSRFIPLLLWKLVKPWDSQLLPEIPFLDTWLHFSFGHLGIGNLRAGVGYLTL